MSTAEKANAPASETQSPARSSVKRGYIACDGCRSRKVRCVLGSKPPCAKCQREHRECVFRTQQHKTGRHRELPKWAQSGGVGQEEGSPEGEPYDDEVSPASQPPTRYDNSSTIATVSSLPQHRQQKQSQHDQGLQHSTLTPGGASSTRSDRQADNDAVSNDRVMTTFLTRPSDALDVLFDAAQPRPSPHRPQSQPSQPGLLNAGIASIGTIAGVVSEGGQVSVSHLSRPSEDVLDLWDRFRFVRQGWFTAQEAVTYLDLLYMHLAPLSTVLADTTYDHSMHHRLVAEEPFLCCALLMIASRFFVLPGAGGVSRSHAIHQRLWQHCEILIRRIMLGQEKLSTAKTRVVASIEALVLISDWPSRSLHLPPETDGWDSELISPGYDPVNRVVVDDDVPLIRWREDVFEPAKRSERMSWMLLGAAVSLSYELDVFGKAMNPGPGDSQQAVRVQRAARLLYIHVTQMAINMGVSSLLPDTFSHKVSSVTPETPESRANGKWETCMRLWMDLIRLMKTASALFFQSTGQSQLQLQSGQYLLLLEHFEPSLTRWEEDFTACSPDMPYGLQPLVLIEFHYLKTYTSALSIQAVVERAVTRNVRRHGDLAGEGLDSCVLPNDYKFIQNVVSESTKVLDIATSMAAAGTLRFAPHRALLSITSSSIFLLKAISLGVKNAANLQASLDALERCIKALRSSATDDMDFSLRYATLLERHVARFRENFFHQGRPDRPVAASSIVVDTSPGSAGYLSAVTADSTFGASSTKPPSFPHLTSLDGDAADQHMNDFDPLQMSMSDDWWARPFDPNIAPFRNHGEAMSLGLELDSLDFLWNLPMHGG